MSKSEKQLSKAKRDLKDAKGKRRRAIQKLVSRLTERVASLEKQLKKAIALADELCFAE